MCVIFIYIYMFIYIYILIYSPAENISLKRKKQKATVKYFSNGTNILYCTINLSATKQSDHQNNLKKETHENGAIVIFCLLSASNRNC